MPRINKNTKALFVLCLQELFFPFDLLCLFISSSLSLLSVCVLVPLCLASGILTQGGGMFGTFVSSFYLQFSFDGMQWFTYKELITDARPKAKVLARAL